MSFLDKILGRKKSTLQQATIDELRHHGNGVSLVVRNFPYYFDPADPREKLQDLNLMTVLMMEIGKHESPDEGEFLGAFEKERDNALHLKIADDFEFDLEFRIELEDPEKRLAALFGALDAAWVVNGIRFVRLR